MEDPDFMKGDFNTSFLDTHPQLFEYKETANEADKLSKLIAEIHHRGTNPYAV
jgi:pyruvate carboxylase